MQTLTTRTLCTYALVGADISARRLSLRNQWYNDGKLTPVPAVPLLWAQQDPLHAQGAQGERRADALVREGARDLRPLAPGG